MARRRNSAVRQALILAFAAGALSGVASTLTLRRRRVGGIRSEDVHGPLMGDVAGPLGETTVPPLGGRIDAPPQGAVGIPATNNG
ncbi:hypothetical protein [Micromonospora inyonensis]|uniref:Uncharacterized protein n=1 Tax=Micromonospora inyonensis TaxID=47866 RepID=A0A1C6RE07_9ACTN|nr:hypothetical protein [Micromonospora inyonensis]SCL15392.1 hypothetical protein GA0074694_1190 [Micromonospora inyonensis]